MKVKITPSIVDGTIKIPSSKSMAHRAIICASLSNGISKISNITYSKDIDATIQCMEALGANIQKLKDSCIVEGCDVTKLNKDITCDCSESGSTLRFLVPITALSNQNITFIGQGRLLSRPMDVYQTLFDKEHITFKQYEDHIEVKGPLNCHDITVQGNISSQFITGLLFALPLLKEDSNLNIVPPYESKSYVNLTIQMLSKFGIEIKETSETSYFIKGNQEYKASDVIVEGDYSQMAFFGVLAALQNQLICSNMDSNSLQGDKIILDCLQKAGAVLDMKDMDILIKHKDVQGQIIDLSNCPDLGPILCVLAAYANGTTCIINAKRLRMKESDRIEAMETELKKWNVNISSTEDSITIVGKDTYEETNMIEIYGHNDHRIVMAMCIFGLCAKTACIIDDAEAITKSYPTFFDDIRSIGGKVEIYD